MSRTEEATDALPARVSAAYRYCEAVTLGQARNFSYGIRLLPPAKRRAMSALYAFSRRVDDIGDGELPPEVKRARLAGARALVVAMREDAVPQDGTDPVAVALHHAATRFPIPLDALDELIDGVLMDVRGERYDTWEDLRGYCRRVAGAVGRLSLGVFGTRPGAREAERAAGYADTLGLALQLTNILRDLREDAAAGRTYLPSRDLEKFGCAAGFLADTPPPGADFTGLMHFQARRAHDLFAEGLRLLPLLDRRSRACVAAMAGIYLRLLARISAHPEAVLRERVALPGRQKVRVALAGLVGRTGPSTRRFARSAP